MPVSRNVACRALVVVLVTVGRWVWCFCSDVAEVVWSLLWIRFVVHCTVVVFSVLFLGRLLWFSGVLDPLHGCSYCRRCVVSAGAVVGGL